MYKEMESLLANQNKILCHNEKLEKYQKSNELNILLNGVVHKNSTLVEFVSRYRESDIEGMFEYLNNFFSTSGIRAQDYLTKIINKAIQDGNLVMPKQNKFSEYSWHIFGHDYKTSLYNKQNNFCKDFCSVVNKFTSENTNEALQAKGLLMVENVKISELACGELVKNQFFNKVEKQEPISDLESYLMSLGQNNMYVYIFNILLPNYTDDEWIKYICRVMSNYYKLDGVGIGIMPIMTYVFGKKVYYQYNVLGKADNRFIHIIEGASNIIQEKYLFVSQELYEGYLNRISNYEHMSDLTMQYKKNYGQKTMILYFQDIIVSSVGEEVFTDYLKVVIPEYIQDTEVVSTSLESVTKGILGFPIHLKKNVPKYQTISKLVYSVWYLYRPEIFYRGLTHDSKIYQLLNLNEVEIQKLELGFVVTLFDSGTFRDAIETIDNLIDMEFIKRRKKVIRESFYYKLLNCSKHKLYENRASLHRIKYYDEIEKHISDRILSCGDELIEENNFEIESKKSIIRIFYMYRKSLHSMQINYTLISSEILREEIKFYFQSNFTQDTASSCLRKVQDIINIVSLIEKRFKIDRTAEIKKDHLHVMIQELQSGDNAIKTVSKKKAILSDFFEFYMNCKDDKKRLLMNPCDYLPMYNLNAFSVDTEWIPEEVACQIDKYIDEAKPMVKLIYKLSRFTGCRFNEISGIHIEDLELDDDGMAILQFIPYKVLKARRMRGKSDNDTKYIPISLYNQVQSYIKETQDLRNKYQFNDVFFSEFRGRPISVGPSTYNGIINKIINKYNILTSEGKVWNFTARQTRKTLGVNLVENGATVHELQITLGHFTKETTLKYYVDVRKSKLGELNTKFYKRKFDIVIGKERLKLFSEEERKILYVDFCLNQREVELGVCTKHLSEGNCKHIRSSNCATCARLCTGIKYLEKWESLEADSQNRINTLERIYIENQISYEEYCKYPEYYREVLLLKQRRAVVVNIKKGSESNGQCSAI